MTMQYFQNGATRLVKENVTKNFRNNTIRLTIDAAVKSALNDKNFVYKVWVFIDNMWVLDKRVSAKDINEAYKTYLKFERGV